MAQTFDIRFARSGGIAALFDAAENSLGWKGGGLLRIDAQGMSFALKRGVVSLLARRRSQLIPAEKIKEVYREGEALRVEFSTDENARAVLPFWAHDRETAARIVQLLPTARTFEVENGTTNGGHKPASRQAALLMAAVVLVGACGLLFIDFNRPAPPVAAVASSAAPTAPLSDPAMAESTASAATGAETPFEAVPPDVVAAPPADDFVPSATLVVPIQRGTKEFKYARDLFTYLQSVTARFSEDYRRDRGRFDSGETGTLEFTTQLGTYEARWRNMGRQIRDSNLLRDPALTGFRAALLEVAACQTRFLSGYAAGLLASDQGAMSRALGEQARADDLMFTARAYVY